MQPSRSPFPFITPARRRWLARVYQVAQVALFVYRLVQALLPDREPAECRPHTAPLTAGEATAQMLKLVELATMHTPVRQSLEALEAER